MASALALPPTAATVSAADFSALDSAPSNAARKPAPSARQANVGEAFARAPKLRELATVAQAARALRDAASEEVEDAANQDANQSGDFSQDSRFAPERGESSTTSARTSRSAPPSATSVTDNPFAAGSDTINRFADSCAELSGVVKDLKNEVAGLRADRKSNSQTNSNRTYEDASSGDQGGAGQSQDMAGPPSLPGLKAKFTSWLKLHDNGYKPGQVVCISVNRTDAQNIKQQEICNLRGYTFVVHDHPQDPDVPEGLSWHKADEDGVLYPWNSPHWSNVATSTTKIPRIKQAPPILQQWLPMPPAVRYEPLYQGGGCSDGSCGSGGFFSGGFSGGSCSGGGCSSGMCGSGGFFGGGGGCASCGS